MAITKNNYQILATVNTTSYRSLSDLYEVLLSLKKDPYLDYERIIINYSSTSKHIVTLVKELLLAIDIPEFFVIFEAIDTAPDQLDFSLSDSHCIYPWTNIEIRNNGDLSPCCKFSSGILNELGQPMRIQNSSIRDAYMSKFMIDLRNSFRQGQYPAECNDCWINEAAGSGSVRQRAKHKFKNSYYRVDYQQDSIDNIRSMDFKLGNACNLSCRICHAIPSSKIATMELAAGRLSKLEFDEIKQNNAWADSDEFWYQFLPIADNLECIDIMGGEPLLVKSHYNFLKKLIEIDCAKHIRLDYTSNGTVFAESYLELWSHFLEVKISFSIDDIGQRFEYQRNGANWHQVNNIIKQYTALRSTKFITELFPTINIQDVYYLPELLSWANTIGFDHISYSFVHHPTYLSIESLSDEAKLLVINKLSAYKEQHPMINDSVMMIQQSKMGCDPSTFLTEMQQRDRERGQNFLDAHTDIAKAMGYR